MRRGSSPISKLRAHTVSIFTHAPKTLHSSRKPPAGQPNVGTTHAHAHRCGGTDGHTAREALSESRRAEDMHVHDRARAAITRLERGRHWRPEHARTQSGRNHVRPLHARAPDPGTERTHGSCCPRRYARCRWTPRCARAMICDRESTAGQHRAGMQGWNGCARAGASHLLSIDTDEDLDALSKQGVV